MLKKIFLFTISIIIGLTITVLGYLWDAPRNSQLLKPFFPKTFFSVANAPSQSLSGDITSMSGNVAWQSRTADYATLINSPVKIRQGEAISTYENGKAVIRFSCNRKHDAFSEHSGRLYPDSSGKFCCGTKTRNIRI